MIVPPPRTQLSPIAGLHGRFSALRVQQESHQTSGAFVFYLVVHLARLATRAHRILPDSVITGYSARPAKCNEQLSNAIRWLPRGPKLAGALNGRELRSRGPITALKCWRRRGCMPDSGIAPHASPPISLRRHLPCQRTNG